MADAADLLIDLATLGEYGLEPVGRTAQPCEAGHRPPAARQPRDRQCTPETAGKSTPTTFASVENDSPYFDILCGSRARRQPSATQAPRRPGPQGKSPRVRALRDARI
ncbi:MAG: hypothetical protein ABW065_12895 [Solirubrobacterales bacterium]